MDKKILVFGYIPKSKGGKQTTGLATGIFDLHNTVNTLHSSFRIIIAATDIHLPQTKIENTEVIGWNKNKLILHILLRPHKLIFFSYKVCSLFRFRRIIPPFSLFFKYVFLDYAFSIVKPDIVHFHGSTGALISTCLTNKVKRILRIHGINGYNTSIPNFKLHRELEKKITTLPFERISFVTNSIKDEWIKKYGKFNCEMDVILNGYNQSIFQLNKAKPENQKKYDLITFSGISENKGQDRVIDALINLNKSDIKLSYLIIGNGDVSYIAKLKKKVKENDLEVQFIDYLSQEEIVKYLHQSKFFILPSITEGFGKVIIESLGSGVPVIIPSHIPLAKEENILNQNNSIIIDDFSTESIEKGLTHIVENQISFRMEEVSASVNLLSWNESAKQYSTIYNSLFAQNEI